MEKAIKDVWGSADVAKIVRSAVVKVLGGQGASDMADDICSDVLLKVGEKIEGFDPSRGKLSTFLWPIATHLAIDALRAAHFHVEFDSCTGAVGPTDEEGESKWSTYPVGRFLSPEAACIVSDARRRVKAYLRTLPARERNIYRELSADDSPETLDMLCALYNMRRDAVSNVLYEIRCDVEDIATK